MILILSDGTQLGELVAGAVGDAVRVSTEDLSYPAAAVGDSVDVVLVDGSDEVERALRLAAEIDSGRLDITVVLYAELQPEVMSTAMKAGVRDILTPGSDDDRVREAVKHALEVAERRHQALTEAEEGDSHRLILVMSPKGGAGKTTVSTNLAVGLAKRAPKQVVLVDGDLQFGDVANALRLLADSSIRDAVAGGLHDVTEVKVHLTPHRSGLFALCAPDTPGVADEITSQAFTKAVTLLSTDFKYVVVDTDPGLDERTLAVMDHATDLVMVAATDVSSVRGLNKTIQALDRIGMTSQRRIFVLNRSDAKVGLSIDDIAATVGMQPHILVPSSRSMPLALNQGTPLLEMDEAATPVPPLWDLVSMFEPDPNAGTQAVRRSGLFGRR